MSGALGGETWSLEGTDAAALNIVAATGVVSMAGRNYEAPVDDNTDNVYEATLRVTDDDGNTATADFTVTVQDVTERATPTITGVASATVNENAVFASAIPAVSGHIGTVTWSLEGDDAADFTIAGTVGVVSMVPRDFEARSTRTRTTSTRRR